MDDKKVERINELYKKSKTVGGLTDEEKAEQKMLRAEYINAMKASLVGQLENTYVIGPDGKKKKVSKKDNLS